MLKSFIVLIILSFNCFAQPELLIILSSNGISYEQETLDYQARVEADGGTVINISMLNDFILSAKSNGYYDSLLCAVDANWGVKKDANNKVFVLYDLFGNRDYAKEDTSESPTWVANSQNGLGGMVFDGVDDDLMVAYDGHLDAQPFTAYTTVRSLAANNSKNFIDNTNYRIIFGIGGGSLYIYAGGLLSDTSSVTTGSTFLYSAVFSGANSRIYKNNILKMTGNAGSDGWGAIAEENYYLGSSGASSWTSIIIYNFIVKQGIGNVGNINQTVNTKYGIY